MAESKNKILIKKILFTLFILIIIRMITQIPIPYIKNKDLVQQMFSNVGVLGIINSFTGNALSQLSIASLSVTPYISASIVIQIMMTSSKRLEELSKQGEYGQNVLNKYKKYLSFFISFISALTLSIALSKSGVILAGKKVIILTTLIFMTAANIIYFLANRISYKGISEGVSIVLLTNIITNIPKDMVKIYTFFFFEETMATQVIRGLIILVILLFIVSFTIRLNDSYTKIPIESYRYVSDNHIRDAYIPLKANVSGIMPIIYAMSILGLPASLNLIVGQEKGFLYTLSQVTSPNTWFDSNNPIYTIGFVLYIGLIVFFSYFYAETTFNPKEISNYLNISSSNIVGVRSGESTVRYLKRALNTNIFIGLIGLLVVTSIPLILNICFKLDLSLAGTSVVVIIAISSEIRKEIKAFLLSPNI